MEGFNNPTGNEDTSDHDDAGITPALPEYFFMNYCFEFFFYSLFSVVIFAIFHQRPR